MAKKNKKNKENNENAPRFMGGVTIRGGGLPPELMAMMGIVPAKKPTVQQEFDQLQEHGKEIVAASWLVQSKQTCCDMEAHDGFVIGVPNSKEIRVLHDHQPESDRRRAPIVIQCVNEHSGESVSVNVDAESLKMLMNILPEVIQAAERERDKALAAEKRL